MKLRDRLTIYRLKRLGYARQRRLNRDAIKLAMRRGIR